MNDSERDREFTAYVAGQRRQIESLAWFLTMNTGQAQDLAQSVLERAYIRWSRIRGDPHSYVRKSLVNAAIDRSRRRVNCESPVNDLELLGRAVVDHTAAVDDRQGLLAALAALTPRERAVVVLRYYCDLTEPATAEALNIAVGTVKSAASRALTKLRVSPHLASASDGT